MIKSFKEKSPKIADSCFVAESADIIGEVEIGEDSSIWYGAVLRGDTNSITIGERTNIQDLAVVHCDFGAKTEIGNDVTVGHKAIIHGATINDNTIIGMGAIVLNNAVIGRNCIIGAGAIVTEGKQIPENSLVVGIPGKVVKTLSEEDAKELKKSAEHYVELSKHHK